MTHAGALPIRASVRASPALRLAAAVVAGVALAGLALRFSIVLPWHEARGGGALDAAWRMGRFFTILNTALVGTVMAGVALGLLRPRAALMAALTVWTAAVGLVYHGLLAHLWTPRGLAWWADQALHTWTPALMVLAWAAFAPKQGLRARDPVLWLGWPLAYLAYALARGAAGDRYPYPFLDPGTIGTAGVVVNAALLGAGFLAGGYALIGLARILPGR